MSALRAPTCLAVSADGRLHVYDAFWKTVFQFREGYWRPVFGVMRPDSDLYDQLPASGPELDTVRSMIPAPQAGLYIADTFGYRIWHLKAPYQEESVAGNGKEGFTADGQDVRASSIGPVYSMAVDPDGCLVFFDGSRLRLRRIEAGGVLTSIGGNSRLEYTPDNRPLLETGLAELTGLAYDEKERVIFCDRPFNIVRLVEDQGRTKTVCGRAEKAGFNGEESAKASNLLLNKPTKLLFADDLGLLVVDRGNRRVRLLPNGVDPGPARTYLDINASRGQEETTPFFSDPYDIARDSNSGKLYCSDQDHGAVFLLRPSMKPESLPAEIRPT